MADQIHLKNFNSRPHGGRREKSVNFPVWLISTHALTEGDRNRFGRKFRKRIFQLTPSRRATKSGSVLVLQWEFQLTPSRRATSGFFSVALIVFNFNSRPHGGRRGRSEMPYDNAAFQLTPSRRATLSTVSPKISSIYFNSRPHGGRQGNTSVFHAGRHFNSCPHGGRRFFKREINARFQFQLTPSRRATGRRHRNKALNHISTHALTEGDMRSEDR